MIPSPLSGRHVLVGGGCGFFGSYLVPALVTLGARVRVVDNLDNSDRASLAEVTDVVELVVGDLRERDVCDDVMAGQELFINLAGKVSGVGFSRAHHGEMLVDNVLCGLVPLQAAQRHGLQHVVTVSSSCVYAEQAPVPTPEIDPFEGEPEQVNEGYGWAKRIHELASRYFAREYGMRMTILRPFNMYGANYRWRSTDRAMVIPIEEQTDVSRVLELLRSYHPIQRDSCVAMRNRRRAAVNRFRVSRNLVPPYPTTIVGRLASQRSKTTVPATAGARRAETSGRPPRTAPRAGCPA